MIRTLFILLAATQDPQKELERLRAEVAEKTARITALQTLVQKQEADLEVMVRQAEVQLAQIQELSTKTEDHRARLEKALNQKKLLEEEVKLLRKPRTLDASKVTAVANEIGLVVLSVGKDDGVEEGDEFVVSRSGEFVTKVVIDRADRKWSAGKVVGKKADPRVGDDARRAAETPETILGIRKELDEVRRQVRELSGRLLPAWSAQGVACEEATVELRTPLGIEQGLLVRQVRAGSPAAARGFQAYDVVVGLTEPRLLEAIDRNLDIPLIRAGRRLTLGNK